MTVQNRTQEFFSAIESLQGRGQGAMQAAQIMNRLHNQTDENNRLLNRSDVQTKSDFTRLAATISREISNTAGKLENLTKLAKKKSLFDDKPVEIEELTFIIKEDIGRVNGQIKNLESYFSQNQNTFSNQQSRDHSKEIVTSLQSRLASAASNFQNVLEIRTQNMKVQQERREQFTYGTSSSNSYQETSPSYYQNQQKQDFISIQMPQQQQLQQFEQRDTYLDSRSEAIESIEKTITDLASLFQQLTTMIQAHDELVQRIDHNVEDVEANVQGAQQQLMRYMNNISSNRWLMLKIFSILILFFLIFVYFFL